MAFDLQIALRRFASRPAYTALMVLTLALGIGASTAVFSVVDQTVLRRAPFAHAERLVDVLHVNRISGGGGSSLTPEKIVGWQSQRAVFERFEAYAPQQMDVTGGTEPERIMGFQVSLGLFPMLAVAPRLGRGFEPGDGAAGSEPVVVISESLWRRRFGGDAGVLGQRMRLNDRDYTVVGVMPRKFRLFSDEEAFWLPVDLEARITDPEPGGFYGIGRLAPGLSVAAARNVADETADRLQAASPLRMTWGLRLEQKRVASVDPTTKTALLVLLGAVAFVLLITCANVANLFLSQAPARQRETAIRTALGASRLRLIRSVLAESVLIALAGGGLGIVLARWGIDAMLAAAPPRMLWMSTTPIEIDGRVLAVAIALTLASGFGFGLFPAISGSHPRLEAMLRRGVPPTGRVSNGRLPGAIVVAEVAFAVVLLVGAALMTRTLARFNAIDPGFEPDGLVTMHIALPSDRYPTKAARLEFFDALAASLRGAGGITDVGISQGTPPSLGAISFGKPEVEGRGAADAIEIIPNGVVSPDFFTTLRIPHLAGRGFNGTEPDDVVIVSKALADKYWPGGNAVGGRFRMGSNMKWRTVVGVVGNVQATAGGDKLTTLQFYYPWARTRVETPPPSAAAPRAGPPVRSYDYRQVVVRANNPAAVIPFIKGRIWAIDPNQPVEQIALVSDTYERMYAKQRFVLLIMGAFALVALVLTAAGVFAVLSQAVAARTREIGVRVALGAAPRDVFTLVVSRGMALAAIGTVLGLAGAYSLTRFLRALLFEVTPHDPASFATVSVLLLVVAALACWLPTRAAMRVQPAVALRAE